MSVVSTSIAGEGSCREMLHMHEDRTLAKHILGLARPDRESGRESAMIAGFFTKHYLSSVVSGYHCPSVWESSAPALPDG